MTDRNRQQTKVLSIRLLPEAFERLQQEASEANVSTSALAKMRIFGEAAFSMKSAPPKPTPEINTLRQILGQAGKIGANQNQIAKHLNRGNTNIDPVTHKRIQTDLEIVRAALLEALNVTWDKYK